jgi:hypothetical protein
VRAHLSLISAQTLRVLSRGKTGTHFSGSCSQIRFAFQTARFGQTFTASRRELRPSLGRTLDYRGRGERRVPLHPQPRVRNKKAHELVTTGTQGRPAFPHAMVLTAYSVLSPVTGLSCHRRFADHPQNLTPASGRQDHTALPYAAPVFAKRLRRAWSLPKLQRRLLKRRSSCAAAASTASRLTFVTIAKRPFSKGGTGRSSKDDLPDGTIEIFLQGGTGRPKSR